MSRPRLAEVDVTIPPVTGDLFVYDATLKMLVPAPIGYNISAEGTGGVYDLTAASALLAFPTTSPSLVVVKPGTYFYMGSGAYEYIGATFAANQDAYFRLRRTNNTPAQIDSRAYKLDTPTLKTETVSTVLLHGFYTTVNSNDILELWGDLTVVPGAGNVRVRAAKLNLFKIG